MSTQNNSSSPVPPSSSLSLSYSTSQTRPTIRDRERDREREQDVAGGHCLRPLSSFHTFSPSSLGPQTLTPASIQPLTSSLTLTHTQNLSPTEPRPAPHRPLSLHLHPYTLTSTPTTSPISISAFSTTSQPHSQAHSHTHSLTHTSRASLSSRETSGGATGETFGIVGGGSEDSRQAVGSLSSGSALPFAFELGPGPRSLLDSDGLRQRDSGMKPSRELTPPQTQPSQTHSKDQIQHLFANPQPTAENNDRSELAYLDRNVSISISSTQLRPSQEPAPRTRSDSNSKVTPINIPQSQPTSSPTASQSSPRSQSRSQSQPEPQPISPTSSTSTSAPSVTGSTPGKVIRAHRAQRAESRLLIPFNSARNDGFVEGNSDLECEGSVPPKIKVRGEEETEREGEEEEENGFNLDAYTQPESQACERESDDSQTLDLLRGTCSFPTVPRRSGVSTSISSSPSTILSTSQLKLSPEITQISQSYRAPYISASPTLRILDRALPPLPQSLQPQRQAAQTQTQLKGQGQVQLELNRSGSGGSARGRPVLSPLSLGPYAFLSSDPAAISTSSSHQHHSQTQPSIPALTSPPSQSFRSRTHLDPPVSLEPSPGPTCTNSDGSASVYRSLPVSVSCSASAGSRLSSNYASASAFSPLLHLSTDESFIHQPHHQPPHGLILTEASSSFSSPDPDVPLSPSVLAEWTISPTRPIASSPPPTSPPPSASAFSWITGMAEAASNSSQSRTNSMALSFRSGRSVRSGRSAQTSKSGVTRNSVGTSAGISGERASVHSGRTGRKERAGKSFGGVGEAIKHDQGLTSSEIDAAFAESSLAANVGSIGGESGNGGADTIMVEGPPSTPTFITKGKKRKSKPFSSKGNPSTPPRSKSQSQSFLSSGLEIGHSGGSRTTTLIAGLSGGDARGITEGGGQGETAERLQSVKEVKEDEGLDLATLVGRAAVLERLLRSGKRVSGASSYRLSTSQSATSLNRSKSRSRSIKSTKSSLHSSSHSHYHHPQPYPYHSSYGGAIAGGKGSGMTKTPSSKSHSLSIRSQESFGTRLRKAVRIAAAAAVANSVGVSGRGDGPGGGGLFEPLGSDDEGEGRELTRKHPFAASRDGSGSGSGKESARGSAIRNDRMGPEIEPSKIGSGGTHMNNISGNVVVYLESINHDTRETCQSKVQAPSNQTTGVIVFPEITPLPTAEVIDQHSHPQQAQTTRLSRYSIIGGTKSRPRSAMFRIGGTAASGVVGGGGPGGITPAGPVSLLVEKEHYPKSNRGSKRKSQLLLLQKQPQEQQRCDPDSPNACVQSCIPSVAVPPPVARSSEYRVETTRGHSGLESTGSRRQSKSEKARRVTWDSTIGGGRWNLDKTSSTSRGFQGFPGESQLDSLQNRTSRIGNKKDERRQQRRRWIKIMLIVNCLVGVIVITGLLAVLLAKREKQQIVINDAVII